MRCFMKKTILIIFVIFAFFLYGCGADDGSDGADGADGLTGTQGEQGPAGPVGPQGEQGPAGPQGEPGPAGAAGAVGPAGSDGATYVLTSPAYSADVSVAVSANMVFNSVTYASGNISYNSVTGIVTFNEMGRYIVNWNVSTDGLIGAVNTATADLSFALSSSQGDFIASSSLLSTGQISGFGIIDIAAAPVTMSLINDSSNDVQLADVMPKANLMINRSDGGVALQISRN
ncbi:collagen-like protein [Geovibrio thiophilus]|uniref:Collagen-like protein n=2 Tax=Geovibrio thiophilus TaxID=139438 RepID=A0A410JUK2_9BACT|nr:collagen-like protein [Geovibrio thiophilus]